MLKKTLIEITRTLEIKNADLHVLSAQNESWFRLTEISHSFQERALSVATECGHLEIVRFFVKYGVNITRKDEVNN